MVRKCASNIRFTIKAASNFSCRPLSGRRIIGDIVCGKTQLRDSNNTVYL